MGLAPPTCTVRCERTGLLVSWRECGRWVVKGLRNLVMGEAGQNKERYAIILLGLVLQPKLRFAHGEELCDHGLGVVMGG